MKKVKGLIDLVQDGVHEGAVIVERTHKAIADIPFAVLGMTPVVSSVSQIVRFTHDNISSLVYDAIRSVNCAAGALAEAAIDVARDLGEEKDD
ncbi:MAG: hypothetical protein JEZ02_09550 [Desulfatibacillum sp.]|nr:hypothetical protein [Desulfatibacillum sp.]